MQRIRSVRSVAVVSVAAALLFTATGCFGPSRPSPQEAASALATAISSGDFSAVPLTASAGQVPGQLEDALAGLEDHEATATVDAAEVDDEDQDRATARLTTAWDLDGADWNYSTQAQLVWDGDAQQWLVDLRPDDVVSGLATGGTVSVASTPAERGAILDGAGEELMMERDVSVLGLDKSRLVAGDAESDSEPDAEALAEAVTESATAVAEVADVDVDAFVARAQAAGDRTFVQAITLRNDGSTEIPTAELAEIPGGRVLEDTAVLAPTRSFARDVLGTYGEPGADQVEASAGELTAGVAVGLSGLQADWEERLAGTPGTAVTITNPEASGADGAGPDAAGPGESVVFSTDPVPGQDVASTLDRDVQAEAEAVVVASDVPAGLVAIRPSDGQVLAAASGPEGWPVAVSGSYAPGSTFKVVTALALLRSGLAPQDTVQCPDTLTVDGMVVGNYDGYPDASVGEIPFAEAFAESCNTVFVGAHDTVSSADEAEAAAALGLASEPETGLSSAVLGSVPDDSTGTEHAANLFGQGVVEASPLGMATVAASVAAGHTVRPVFVSEPAVDTPAVPETSITEEEAEQLRSLMAGVVQTGTAEMLQDVPGAPVLAKTGTAQFVADGEDLAHTWLVAIHGDLAVALFFNEGLGGGHDNGPVVRDFLTAVEEIIPSEG